MNHSLTHYASSGASRFIPALVATLKTISVPLIGPLFIVLIWWAAAELNWVSDRLLPGPYETFGSLANSVANGDMLLDALATLKLTTAALGIAVVLGLPVGIVHIHDLLRVGVR